MAIQECYIFFLLWKLICFLKKQAFWKHVALEGTHVCGWAKWRHHFMDVCMLFFIPRWLFRDFQVAVQSSIYRWKCFQKDVKKVPKVSKGAKKAISWVYLFHFLHLFSFFLSFGLQILACKVFWEVRQSIDGCNEACCFCILLQLANSPPSTWVLQGELVSLQCKSFNNSSIIGLHTMIQMKSNI